LYLEIFGHAGKPYKNIKNQALEAIWSNVGHHRPLGGATWPHKDVARCPTCPCHITDPWERSSKASPPLISSWFNIKGSNEASHGSLTWRANITNMTNIYNHPNPLMTCGPSFYKEGGPTYHRRVGQCHPYAARRLTPSPSPLHASMQRSTCSNALYPWLYGGLIQWRWKEGTQIDDVALE